MVQFGHLRSRRNKQLYCLSPKVTYFIALGSFFTTTCGLYLYFISVVFGGISYSTPATVNTSEAEEKSNRNSSQIGGWVSPHQVDCKSFFDEPDEQVYKQSNIHKPSEDGVSRHIWEDGCWECDHIKAVLKALSQYENSYFLDIGGNIGMWSLSAAAANYHTVTIEAFPTTIGDSVYL